MVQLVFVCWDLFFSCPETIGFLILISPLFPPPPPPKPFAGIFFPTRKSNWRRQDFQTPWQRSLQNTTVSCRQNPARAKHDGPGELSSPIPKHFVRRQRRRARNTAGVLISSALNYIFKNTHVGRLECTLTVLLFLKCLRHRRSSSLVHKRFILFFYSYSI